MGARLSVGINLSDNSICSLQKGGEKPLQLEEIKKTLIRAQEITKELSNYLPEA
jgi:exosome complex component RRP42